MNSFQAEQGVLEVSAKLLATGDVVVESKQRDMPIPEVLAVSERSPFCFGCTLILPHLLVLHILVSLRSRGELLPSCADEPLLLEYSVRTRVVFSQHHLGVPHDHKTFSKMPLPVFSLFFGTTTSRTPSSRTKSHQRTKLHPHATRRHHLTRGWRGTISSETRSQTPTGNVRKSGPHCTPRWRSTSASTPSKHSSPLPKWRMKCWASDDHRPFTSQAKTTSLALPLLPHNSGKVASLSLQARPSQGPVEAPRDTSCSKKGVVQEVVHCFGRVAPLRRSRSPWSGEEVWGLMLRFRRPLSFGKTVTGASSELSAPHF